MSKKWLNKEYWKGIWRWAITWTFTCHITGEISSADFAKNCSSIFIGVNSNKDSFTERDVIAPYKTFPLFAILSQLDSDCSVDIINTLSLRLHSNDLSLSRIFDLQRTIIWHLELLVYGIYHMSTSTCIVKVRDIHLIRMKVVFINLEMRAVQLGLIK